MSYSNRIDTSQVGEIICSAYDCLENELEDWLEDNSLQDSSDARKRFLKECGTFLVELLDNVTFHHCGYAELTYNDFIKSVNISLANDVVDECIDGDEHRFEILAYIEDDSIDINDSKQLNDIAKKLLPHGGYYRNCRGFILSDGTIIYTEIEHNQCSAIPGVKGTFHFLELGNIRLVKNSIDIATMPTYEQIKVLEEVLDSYYGNTVYLDMSQKGKEKKSLVFNYCETNEVLSQVKRYYGGIRISENSLREMIVEQVNKQIQKYIQ